MATELTSFGNRLRELREKQGLTQQQLADKAGMKTHSNISHFERGSRLPRYKTLETLAKALDVSLAEFDR